MSPVTFTPEKECYTVLFLQIFRKADIKERSVSDTLETTNAGQESLEELIQIQALSLDLREAVMACLCGRESRRWTVAELVERFKNLGVCASRAGVTAALAELALELELSGWAPWRLLERGTEWILEPKRELLALLSGVRGFPLKQIPSEEHKAVLLVVIGHRRKGGISKARVGDILGLDASKYLDDLLREGLIYCDPSRELNFWRPTPEALLALGLRSFADIPALKELEEWFEAVQDKKSPREAPNLDPFFERTSKLASRRFKRELERRGTLGEPLDGASLFTERIPTEESGSDLFRSDGLDAAALSCHAESSQSVVQGCSAQGSAVWPGEKEP
jgi:chromosome segregation and condensation protein ScpB